METFDWVTARSSCSLTAAFEGLKTDIKRDVETRNHLRPPNTPYQFCVKVKEEEIRVYSESNIGPNSVVFTLLDKSISVQDGKGQLIFQATVTLDHEGRCVAKINGMEYEFWEMRHIALEKLFFETF